jgi:hypothetical protein
MIHRTDSIALALAALLASTGCSEDSFTVRGRLVSTDGIPTAGVSVQRGGVHMLTDADGVFEYVAPVRLLEHLITVTWEADNQELVQWFNVRPDRVYDGDEFELPDIPVWRLGLIAAAHEDGVDFRWNEDEDLGNELSLWAPDFSEFEASGSGMAHVSAALLESERTALRVDAYTTAGSRNTSPAYLTHTIRMPMLRTSDFRGARCSAFARTFEGGVEETSFPGCPLTDGDLSTTYSATSVADTGYAGGFAIDLGRVADIDHIVVRARSLGWQSDPTSVLVASSDLTFEQVGVQDRPISSIQLPAPRAVRYVRLQANGFDQAGVSASEVSVFLAR